MGADAFLCFSIFRFLAYQGTFCWIQVLLEFFDVSNCLYKPGCSFCIICSVVRLLFHRAYVCVVCVMDQTERVCQEAMVAECREVNEFHLPMVICSVPEKVSENDLLLVSNKKVNT